jgi:hypothetical protein
MAWLDPRFDFCDAEVGKLGLSLRVNKDVTGFDVWVDYLVLVCERERLK